MSSVKDRVIATVTKNVPKVVSIAAEPTEIDAEALVDSVHTLAQALNEKLDEVLPDTRVIRFELTPAQAFERLKTVAPDLVTKNDPATPAVSAQHAHEFRQRIKDTKGANLAEVIAAAELGISVQAYRHFTAEIASVRAAFDAQTKVVARSVNEYISAAQRRQPTRSVQQAS